MMPQPPTDAALRALLDDCPVLKLILLDRDYGKPCPADRWAVKAAIDHLLKPAHEGMVLDLDVLEREDGAADDVLLIGVVELEKSLPKLIELLKSLSVPAGAILVHDGSTENLMPDLPAKETLVRQMTDDMIQMLLSECMACVPSDWQAGKLTIQCDGDWLGYQLKNALSPNAAIISGPLRDLCEEIAVLMWKNGNQWREAVLQYEGKDFTIKFSYGEPLHPIPRTPVAAQAKPWWKFW
ncbi:hypothetical protein [Undibacterium sp. KW1]|uniref:hypothetical protein n=1 Tax=Undibacterium sp. KW1 TaxID=2058624 RepID=UPI001389BCBA|nr:hypothetical protein [Undibacterium sp. KW1]